MIIAAPSQIWLYRTDYPVMTEHHYFQNSASWALLMAIFFELLTSEAAQLGVNSHTQNSARNWRIVGESGAAVQISLSKGC